MILIDTNALYFLSLGKRRARPLERFVGQLRASPISLLELHMLAESGRISWSSADVSARFHSDTRWLVDDPPVGAVIDSALTVGWTREPFDRLLVAHARMRRWKIATSDGWILENLSPSEVIEL